MECYVEKDINVYDFILNHSSDVVILGYGGADPSRNGYYHFGLACKMQLSIVTGKVEGTANRSILYGVLAAIKEIKKPCNIFVITSTALGFNKALKNRGPNQDICHEVMFISERNNCKLTIITAENTADQIKKLLRDASKYFKLISRPNTPNETIEPQDSHKITKREELNDIQKLKLAIAKMMDFLEEDALLNNYFDLPERQEAFDLLDNYRRNLKELQNDRKKENE